MAVRCEICGQSGCGCMADPRAVELVMALRLVRNRRQASRRRVWLGAMSMFACAMLGLALSATSEPMMQAFGGLLFTFGVLSGALVTMVGAITGLQASRELRQLRSRQALPAARLLS